LEGINACHIRDGAALIDFLAWLENKLTVEKEVLDEAVAADKLEELRSKHKYHVGPSFDIISSTGANAAVIHYSPIRGNCPIIDPNTVYLCDFSAQYFDGTTDITRTLHFGKPKEMERKVYTLVLKALLQISSDASQVHTPLRPITFSNSIPTRPLFA